MAELVGKQKVVVVGAGPVGALAALYAAKRGDSVEVYEFRAGENPSRILLNENLSPFFLSALYYSLFSNFIMAILF